MTPVRTLFAVALPSLLAGGLLFGSATLRADAGHPAPPAPPAVPAPRPAPPAPPAAPAPPAPPAIPGLPAGISVEFHDGKLQITGIQQFVAQQLAEARAQLGADKDLPPAVRAKLDQRLGRVQDKLAKRLAKLDATNLDELGEQLDGLGSDVSEELEGLGEDLGSAGQAWADQLGKQIGNGFSMHGTLNGNAFHWDDQPSHAAPSPHAQAAAHADDDDDRDDDDDHDHDDDAVIADLGDVGLTGPQRAEIAKLRADTDRRVAAAQAEVTRLSAALQAQLADPAVADADVARAIDAISAKEAEIRKARVLAWVAARRSLDAGQRAKVEGAAHKRGK